MCTFLTKHDRGLSFRGLPGISGSPSPKALGERSRAAEAEAEGDTASGWAWEVGPGGHGGSPVGAGAECASGPGERPCTGLQSVGEPN